MSEYGVTANGFNAKRLADIKIEIENKLKAELGENINLLPESVLGQLIGIFSERESLIWELAEAVYNSQYPDTAESHNLDNVVAITGITRHAATKSIIKNQILFGNVGTVVPKGTIFSVDGNPSARFITDTDSEPISLEGETSVDLTAENTGPIQAHAATLTVIETPVSGLDSTTNPDDAILGRYLETDAELRLRRQASIQIAGAGTIEAIKAKLLELDDVTAVFIFENADIIEQEERPPKSFEVVVQGGDEDEIAKAIFESKPAGIETCGDITKEITDTQGFSYDIKFSRPLEIEIYIIVNLSVNENYPEDGDEKAKQEILDYGNKLEIGEDIIVYPKLVSVLNNIPGITDIEVAIGTAPNPISDNNITIAGDEIAMFSSNRITVNSS